MGIVQKEHRAQRRRRREKIEDNGSEIPFFIYVIFSSSSSVFPTINSVKEYCNCLFQLVCAK